MLFQITMIGVTHSSSPSLVFKKIWGEPEKNHFAFYPIGVHFSNIQYKKTKTNNYQWLIAGEYKGISVGTFINSHHDRVVFAGFKRHIYGNDSISINYLIGAMYGYKDHLKDFLGPVLGADPGPVLAFDIKYMFSEKLSIDFVTYGVGGLAGVSYYF